VLDFCLITCPAQLPLHVTETGDALEMITTDGRSGLAVACVLQCARSWDRIALWAVIRYRKNHCDLQPWAWAVHILPAVPKSTQPSTLFGTVNEYQLLG